jgi:hypothetical protein
MARTIEHIVATHKHATALRAQGKNIWPHQANIREIIRGGQGQKATPGLIASVANRVAQVLRAKLPKSFFDVTHESFDFHFNDAVETFEDYTVAGLTRDASEGLDIEAEFNGWLEDIYDWADNNRVWLGR